MTILEEAKQLQSKMIEIRRTIHANPEIGNNLPKTKEYVFDILSMLGYKAYEVGGGLVCDLNLNKDITILLRADMDALPMKEESGLEFASKNDYAHTCGHDIHTTTLLAAAEILLKHKSELNCNVRFMFQDDEENANGAKIMVDAGVLKDINYAFGLHVKPDYKVGLINCTSGKKTASYDSFEIEVIGKGGHGAWPKLAIDPIKIASELTLKLDDLVENYCEKGSKSVLTIGVFNAGTSPNTIPERAYLKGTMRSDCEDERNYIKNKIDEILSMFEQQNNCKINIKYLTGIYSLYNSPTLVEMIKGELDKNLGDYVDYTYDYLPASEDFSIVSTVVPTVYLNLGTGLKQDGYMYTNHNPKVIYNEDALPYAVCAYVSCALGIQEGRL